MDAHTRYTILFKAIEELGDGVAIVEGKNDASALQALGVERIVLASSATRLAGELEGKVFLLFDFDQEGERKTREYADAFFNEGKIADVRLRDKFRTALGIRCFEDAARRAEALFENIR